MGRTRFYWMFMLWPWPSRQQPKCCTRHVVSIWWSFLRNCFETWLQKTKLWARHDFAARSYCDLDLQGSDPNLLATRRLNMVIISLKYFWNPISNIKVMGRTRFYWKVMLWPWPSRQQPKCCTRHVVSIWWSFLQNCFETWLQITKLWAGHDFAARSCCDLDL